MKMPELLSPAGGKAHLKAAVNNGADAVYLGGLAFNARIFADNFRDDELPEAIEYAHLRGVKVYITLNTLLKDSELVKAFEYANYLYSIGADGLIIQDMGLARLLRKYIPDFPLHLSTQATLYNKEALDTAETMGFSRVVPARELTIDEIRELSSEAAEHQMDVEIFVHGALCMCYSGQCQMSRMLGGGRSTRSGNRGTCAQPCRQPYTDDNGRTYYALSPKDLCQIENIPEIVLSGASSFKIEGRMKAPEYVATVTRIYRKYLDRFSALVNKYGTEEASRLYSVDEEDLLALRQIFNRGNFTEGYLHEDPGDDILSGSSPKNQGIYAGRVVAVIDSEDKAGDAEERRAVRGALRRGKVLVCVSLSRSFASDIIPGDGLEFRSEYEDVPREATGGVTTLVKKISDREYILGDFDRGVETGDLAFKVTDRRLIDEALGAPDKKLPVTMVFTAREGQYPVLAMTDVRAGYTAEITADHITERAKKAATEPERIEGNLSRLGDTPFYPEITGIDVEIDDDIMMPVSIVNRMRREAADELAANRKNAVLTGRHPLTRAELDVIESGEMLGAKVLDLEKYRKNIQEGSIRPMSLEEFMDMPDDEYEEYVPYILNVSKGNLDRYINDNFARIAKRASKTGILIGNMGWIGRFRNAGVRVYGDWGLNVYNEQARLAYEEAGAELYMPSHETDIQDERGIPLMITEHHIDSCHLTDRKGAEHKIRTAPSGDKTLIY